METLPEDPAMTDLPPCTRSPAARRRAALSLCGAWLALAAPAALSAAPATAWQDEQERIAGQVDAGIDAGPVLPLGGLDAHGLVRTHVLTGDYTGLPDQLGADGPEFGRAIALEGGWLVVGAPGTTWERGSAGIGPHGAVFVFRDTGSGWIFQQRLLVAPNPAGAAPARCGAALAMRLPHLAIGCPDRTDAGGLVTGYVALYRLNEAGDAFVMDHRLYGDLPDRCGVALAMTRNFLAYGCPTAREDQRGRVGVYRRNPLTDRFTEFDGNRLPVDPTPGMAFGSALAMHEPGTIAIGPTSLRLAIGAPNAVYQGSAFPRGEVQMFHRDRDSGAWSSPAILRLSAPGQGGNELAAFGSALAINASQLVAGAPNNRFGSLQTLPGPGSVHRFEFANTGLGGWQWQAREAGGALNLPDGPHQGMRHGAAVALLHDSLAAVAAPATDGRTQGGAVAAEVGLVSLRRTAAGDWSVFNHQGELRPPALSTLSRSGGRFGQALAAHPAGRVLAVGYPFSGSTLQSRPRGAVWVYGTDLLFTDGFQ